MRIKLMNPYVITLAPEDPPGDGSGGGGTGGGGNSGTGKAGDGKTGEDGEKKFSQADVDRMIADRARRIARTDYGDYDDLKAKAEKFDAAEANKATDLDKATQRAREEAAAEVRAELMAERVLDRAEIIAAGTWADSRDARLRLRDRAAEFVDKKTGQIDADAIKAALAEELKAAPHLASTATRRPGVDTSQGAPNGKPDRGAAGRAEAERRFGKKT